MFFVAFRLTPFFERVTGVLRETAALCRILCMIIAQFTSDIRNKRSIINYHAFQGTKGAFSDGLIRVEQSLKQVWKGLVQHYLSIDHCHAAAHMAIWVVVQQWTHLHVQERHLLMRRIEQAE